MEFLEISRNLLLVLHFVGLASLLGGFLTQIRTMAQGLARIIPAMVHGVWTAFVTGLLLVGVAEARIASGADLSIDHTKIAVKTVVVLVVLVLVMTQRKKESVKTPIFASIGALTLTNVVLAIFW
jgi:hypothetical protein